MSFEGRQAREFVVSSESQSRMEDGTQERSLVLTRTYSRRTGDVEATQYGSVSSGSSTSGDIVSRFETRFVWDPPRVQSRVFTLAAGESVTETASARVTNTATPPGPPAGTTSTVYARNTTTTYRGVETVTVPAGRYEACRFEMSDASVPGWLATWWATRGDGIVVKTVTSLNGTVSSTEVAIAVKVIGAPR